MKISHHTYQTNNYTLLRAVAPTPFDVVFWGILHIGAGSKLDANRKEMPLSFVHFRLEHC